MKLSDLKKFNNDYLKQLIEFEPKFPDGTDLGITLEIYSLQHPEKRGIFSKLLAEQSRLHQLLVQEEDSAKEAELGIKIDEVDENLTFELIKTVKGLTDDEGKPVKSTDIHRKQVASCGNWLWRGVIGKASDQRDFFKASKQNS